MFFMVVEHFRDENARAVHDRFERDGRMLPPGVVYHASWIDPSAARCFQIMEAETRSDLDAWIARWADLVEFDVIAVVPSAEFWAAFRATGASWAAGPRH